MIKKVLTALITLGLVSAASAYTLPQLTQSRLPHPAITKKKLDIAAQAQGDTLDLSYAQLQDSDMPTVIAFLNSHPLITNLILRNNNDLTATGLVPLAAIKTLKKLDLTRSYKECNEQWQCTGGLTANDILPFAQNTTLTELDISMHSLGDEGAKILAQNKTLQVLDVGGNDLTDLGGQLLAANTNYVELYFWGNTKVGDKTAHDLSRNLNLHVADLSQTSTTDFSMGALAYSKSITNLELMLTDVTDKGAATLSQDKHLQVLNLCGDAIGASGAQALAQTTSLKTLMLCSNMFIENPVTFGDAGTILFANNTSITDLTLEGENITALGIAYLSRNTSIQDLDITDNLQIGDTGALSLSAHPNQYHFLGMGYDNLTDTGAQYLSTMRSLQSLWLFLNEISDNGAISLSYAPNLQFIDLPMNQVHDTGAVAFAQTTTLVGLNLMDNPISQLGITALENNHYIKYLMVSPPDSSKQAMLMSHQNYCYRLPHAMECVHSHR